LECIELGCISKEDAKMIDEASMLYYHGMLSLMVNKRVKYSVKEATEKTINHIKQIIRNVNGLKNDIGKSVSLAEKTVQKQPNNCGALHNLAGSLYMYAQCEGVSEDKKVGLLEKAQK
jgi:hypothetical protein